MAGGEIQRRGQRPEPGERRRQAGPDRSGLQVSLVRPELERQTLRPVRPELPGEGERRPAGSVANRKDKQQRADEVHAGATPCPQLPWRRRPLVTASLLEQRAQPVGRLLGQRVIDKDTSARLGAGEVLELFPLAQRGIKLDVEM